MRQEEGESMDTFGYHVFALKNLAFPDLINAPNLFRSLPKRTKMVSQQAMKFRDPRNDLSLRLVPSGHYNVYGETLLRDPLGVMARQTSAHRQEAMWQL